MRPQDSFTVNSYHDIIRIRMEVREAAKQAGLLLSEQSRISLATSNLLEDHVRLSGVIDGEVTIKPLVGESIGISVECIMRKPVDACFGKVSSGIRSLVDMYEAHDQAPGTVLYVLIQKKNL